jgi:hypothetical protein
VLDETVRTLERPRKELAAVRQKSAWSYVRDVLKIVWAILPFLLVVKQRRDRPINGSVSAN